MAISIAQQPFQAVLNATAQGMLAQIPNIYFNGFALGLSPADASLLVTLDAQPQVRLSMSFTTAKTLSENLRQLVEKLEAATNHTIMKTDEVDAGLRKIEPEERK
jgi:hypothetical protein